MNQKIYENYAKLAVKIGINLQEGQDVVITASTRLVDIVKEIVKVCYENKARSVRVEWTNEQIDKLHWLYQDTEVMSQVPVWQEEKAKSRETKQSKEQWADTNLPQLTPDTTPGRSRDRPARAMRRSMHRRKWSSEAPSRTAARDSASACPIRNTGMHSPRWGLTIFS